MENKKAYPMISEKAWWQIRNQFKKTIPSKVNISYLKSLLNLTSNQSARNILTPLKQMGIIDNEGVPQQRANDWRNDTKYGEVCEKIIKDIYPQELLDLFPDGAIELSNVKEWFMDTCSLGNAAAGKDAQTFLLLKSKNIQTKEIGNKPKKINHEIKNANSDIKNALPIAKSSNKVSREPVHGLKEDKSPSIHIDLQIHISPDASPDQIDKIFESISKHLYGK